MKSTTFLHSACIGMVPNMLILMFIPKFNHIYIAMITLGVITLYIICTREIATTESNTPIYKLSM
jgi:hypothetical protein